MSDGQPGFDPVLAELELDKLDPPPFCVQHRPQDLKAAEHAMFQREQLLQRQDGRRRPRGRLL